MITDLPHLRQRPYFQAIQAVVRGGEEDNKNNNNDNNNDDNSNNRIEGHNLRCLQSPHCATNCLQHVRSSGPGAIMCKSRATHQALITCNLQCTTWYEGAAQLLISQNWNHIYFSFILLAETINRWRRGGNWGTQRKPLTMSFRKCCILMIENSSPKRDLNPHSSIHGRLGKHMC